MSAKTIVAASKLDDALINVARSAQELSDTSEKNLSDYTVGKEEMEELREALKVWQEKSQEFLKVVSEEGKRG